MKPTFRYNWTIDEVVNIHDMPLLDLVFKAQTIHRHHQNPSDIQRASLLSIKTGKCPEDCAYCPQSAHHKKTESVIEKLMDVASVLAAADTARASGAQRFCMGAAWRSVKDGPEFEAVLDMVRGVKARGMEACVTLGMLTPNQAERLKDAGLTAYNHNLDTGPDFYKEIITTRTFDDRLKTINAVRQSGIQVCSGGIIGMGESIRDRAEMLQILANHDPHPESVPINALVPVKGTPLENRSIIDPLELVRMCATTRIIMPETRVRLSAGRRFLTREAQILCFICGANSIFVGEKLLTTANNEVNDDDALFQALGLNPQMHITH